MVDWSTDQCLQLIDLYEKHPVLWDPKNIWYNSKNKKAQAWKEISDLMGIEEKTVHQKMLSLLGSFRAQRSKCRRRIETLDGKRVFYKSKWFAFDKMQFLIDRNSTQANSTNTDIDVSDTSVDFQIDSLVKTEMSDSSETHIEDFEQCLLPNVNDMFSTSTLETIESDPITTPLKQSNIADGNRYIPYIKSDRFDTYGQHVANKLRTYSKKASAIVEHLINNILFEADMGHYDEGIVPKK